MRHRSFVGRHSRRGEPSPSPATRQLIGEIAAADNVDYDEHLGLKRKG